MDHWSCKVIKNIRADILSIKEDIHTIKNDVVNCKEGVDYLSDEIGNLIITNDSNTKLLLSELKEIKKKL